MDSQQGLLQLWKIAHQLVSQKDYYLLHTETEKTELFLVKNKGRHYRYIRLQLIDYMWPAQVDRDLQENARRLEEFKKKVRAHRVDGIHIYLFGLSPMPELAAQITNTNRYPFRGGELYTRAFDTTSQQFIGDQTILAEFDLSPDMFTFNEHVFYTPEHIMTYMREIEEVQQQREKAEKQVFYRGASRFTLFFVIINVILFVLMELAGGSQKPEVLILFGAKFTPLILQGEWWRFITPIFLHIGFIHLLLNSVALYYIGTIAEKIYGSPRFLWIYLMAGVAGVAASFYFSPHLSAGASGAIFGLFGSLLHFGLRYRDLFFRTIGNDVIAIVAINLTIGFLFPGMIDNYAHLGGLVGGFLAATSVSLPGLGTKYPVQRFLALVSLFGILASAIYFGIQLWTS